MKRLEEWVEQRRLLLSRLYWVIAWSACLLAYHWLPFAYLASTYSLSAFVLHPVGGGHWKACTSPAESSFSS